MHDSAARWLRDRQSCVWIALLAGGLGACRSGAEAEAGAPASANGCTQLEPGELATLDAEVHVLASENGLGRASGSLAPALLPDGGDVYWYDLQASVFVERQIDGRVVELRHGEPRSATQHEVALGLAASADRLYVGYGQRPNEAIDFMPLEYSPPGRLLSISKQDGQAELLLELKDGWLAPIRADGERVIVFAMVVSGVGFYQVPLAEPRLEPLSVVERSAFRRNSSLLQRVLDPFQGGQVVGDQLYWVSNEYPRRLLRSGFDYAEPEVLLQMPEDDYFFSAGPGYILTAENVILPGYHAGGKDFVLRDDSGCRSVRGPRTDVMSSVVVDAKYAYWSGYRVSGPEHTPEDLKLIRVDVESGALTRLNTPGFTPSLYSPIAGQDDARVFLYNGETLVSLRKP